MYTVPGDVERCQKALAERLGAIRFLTVKGIAAAGLHLQGETQRLVPVRTGNLRASAFTVYTTGRPRPTPAFRMEERKGTGAKISSKKQRKLKVMTARDIQVMTQQDGEVVRNAQYEVSPSIFQPEAIVGFTAYYSIYVHEMPLRHVTGQWKFLSTALMNNFRTILAIVATEIRPALKSRTVNVPAVSTTAISAARGNS